MQNIRQHIIQERIHEIQQYRHVLSRLLGYEVKLDQAITDWFANEFDNRTKPADAARAL